MDLLIQIVLVALILIPIVLLLAFAGCGIDFLATGQDPRPTDLVATATGTQSIKVTWQEHVGLTSYDVARAQLGESGFDVRGSTVADRESLDDDSTLPGEPPVEGTTYLYQLRTQKSDVVVADGATATAKPNAPTLLKLEADVDRITITWKNNSLKADRFVVRHRRLPDGPFEDIATGGTIDPIAKTVSFTHPVTEGTAHQYQVAATVGGFDKNLFKQVESDDSAVLVGTAWKRCYAHRPHTEVAGLDFRNGCMVQRIRGGAGGSLLNGGKKVRITLAAAPESDIAIRKMSISQAKVSFAPNTSQNQWDSEEAPTPVTLDGTPPPQVLIGGGIVLKANTRIVLNPVDYELDETVDLIIAFDIAENAGTSAFADVTGSNLFFKVGTAAVPVAEAIRTDRTSGPPPGQDYGLRADRVYLVEQIDVLG